MVDQNIKHKVASPFQVVSSSATGGYVDQFHKSFKFGAEVVNSHEDRVMGDSDYGVLQSPFTNQWVGGHQHRHVSVNSGQDNARNRQEAYHVDTPGNGNIRLYSHKYFNSPPSYWTRDETAKRSLNIKNILTTTSSFNHGNYRFNYEAVQISGRRNNSLLKNLVTGSENIGVLRTRFVSGTIHGVSLNSLLDNARKSSDQVDVHRNETTFVSRFNSPGGYAESSRASLDPESEEFSPNNPLPYRNMKLREIHISGSTKSSLQFNGLDIPTKHGVNRNTLRNLAGEVQKDNFFVQRPIPRTDIQYAWISSSATTKAIDMGGYQQFSSSYNRGEAFTDIVFKGEQDDRVLEKNRKELKIDLNTNTVGPISKINLSAYSATAHPTGNMNDQGFTLKNRSSILIDANTGKPYIAFGGGGMIVLEQEFTTPIQLQILVRDDNHIASPLEIADYVETWISTDQQQNWSVYNNCYHEWGSDTVIQKNITIQQTLPYYVRIRFVSGLATERFGVLDILASPLSQSLSSYSFSAWKQIRTGEDHLVARELKKNNIISVENVPQEKFRLTSNSRNVVVAKRADSVSNYVDTPFSTKYKPLKHKFIFKGNSNPLLGHEVVHTYNNNLSTFANKELVNKLGLTEKKEQIYNKLLDMYNNPDIPEIDNPISKLLGYTIEETIYPKEQNTGLAETRGRREYILNKPGFDRDGYDRQFGTQRVFWRDRLEDRARNLSGSYNSQNYIMEQLSSVLTNSYSGTYSRYAGDSGGSSNVIVYYQTHYSASLTNRSRERSSVMPIDKLTGSLLVLTSSYYGLNRPSIYIYQTSSFRHYVREFSGELNNFSWIDVMESASGKQNTPEGMEGNSFSGRTHNLIRVSDFYYISTLTSLPQRSLPLFPTFSEGSPFCLTLNLSSSLVPKPQPRYCAFLGGIESGSRPYWNSGDLNDLTLGKPLGVVSSSLDSGLRYAVDEMTDKKPWFDSYEKYIDDIRGIAKDYSVLPEFRISEHMNYYVSQSGGNFRAKNNSFLTIDGIGDDYRSSLVENGIYSNNFFKTYINSDVMKNHDEIKNENKDVSQIDKISLKVSGIKKLLPYNGFYPINRTIQLANLYSKYVDDRFHGGIIETLHHPGDQTPGVTDSAANYNVLVNDDIYDIAFKHAALEPLFSPGILYNTIKSGISVDWPAITGSTNVAEMLSIRQDGLLTRIDSRIPFETIIFPELGFKTKLQITSSFSSSAAEIGSGIFEGLIDGTYLMSRTEPSQLSFDGPVDTGDGQRSSMPFAYIKEGSYSPQYSMAMSNFLAETVKFFLQSKKLNTFSSTEQSRWKTFSANKIYYMDIVLKKTPTLVMMEAFSSSYSILPTKFKNSRNVKLSYDGRYFGYPSSMLVSSRDRFQDPAYAPFTPPYFEGDSVLRCSFSPTETRTYSLDEVFNGLVTKDINTELLTKCHANSIVVKNKMSIEQCINLKGKTRTKEIEFLNKNRIPNIVKQTSDTGKDIWVISPKLETPVLDFSKQPFIADTGSYWISSGFGRGMWSGYGDIPIDSKGIFFELRESFPMQKNKKFGDTLSGSLIEQCGFTPQSKKIGQIAGTKEISEAIVIIPYLDYEIPHNTINIEGHNFIQIHKNTFDTQKQNIDNGDPAIKIGNFGSKEEIQETSISKMIKTMENYIIPPQYNFLEYPDIPPFAMYFFEFKHILDQQDLSDIWQGVLPEIGRTAELDEVEISHPSNKFELFYGRELPKNLRWMVFKVKKKAEKNYFSVTADSTDDDRFKFDFQVGRKDPEYSYNWPYDYFSLVEFAKVQLSIDYVGENKEDEIVGGSGQPIINNQLSGPALPQLKQRGSKKKFK